MIALLIAIFTYLSARKSGASSTTALMTGAAAGIGTHYLTTNTQWGKDNIQPLNDKIGEFLGFRNTTVAGGKVFDETGKEIIVPEGSTLKRFPDGSASLLTAAGAMAGTNQGLVTTVGGLVVAGSLGKRVVNFFSDNVGLIASIVGLWLLTRNNKG